MEFFTDHLKVSGMDEQCSVREDRSDLCDLAIGTTGRRSSI